MFNDVALIEPKKSDKCDIGPFRAGNRMLGFATGLTHEKERQISDRAGLHLGPCTSARRATSGSQTR